MDYKPKPIDTSSIALNADLKKLAEYLAKNTHEVWAARRMQEGWTHGPERDDTKKETPVMVAYDELPEGEKDYDRQVSQETIRVLLKLGYTIVRDSDQAVVGVPPQSTVPTASELAAMDLDACLACWQALNVASLHEHPEVFASIGDRFKKLGEAMLAYDVFDTAIRTCWPDDARLTVAQRPLWQKLLHQRALALANSGSLQDALVRIEEATAVISGDPEFLALRGRCQKDQAFHATDPDTRHALLTAATNSYDEAMATALKSGGPHDVYYAAINVATTAMIAGDSDLAHERATLALRTCEEILAGGESLSVWVAATMGEAALILGDLEASERHYANAVRLSKGDITQNMSMSLQADRLAECLPTKPAVAAWFPEPILVCITSAAPDSSYDQAKVDERIAALPTRTANHPLIVYAAIDVPLDLAVCEHALTIASELNVAIIRKPEIMIRAWRQAHGEDWANRLQALLDNELPQLLHDVHDRFEPYLYFLNTYTLGQARHRGAMLHSPPIVIEQRARDALAISAALQVDLSEIPDSTGVIRPAQPDATGPEKTVNLRRYTSFIFADFRRYSDLSELQLAIFATEIIGRIGELLAPFADTMELVRTMGDGLFIVTDDHAAALRMALLLNDLTKSTSMESLGLPVDMAVRIALDAGPCFSYDNNVVDSVDFGGRYINRAARIEPVTPPGEIYASRSYVCLACSRGIEDVEFNYAGIVQLPKKAGYIPVYHVRPTR